MRPKKLLSILLMVALILSLAISQGSPSLAATKVKLVYDKDKYDQYGRTLAYVYLGKSMFNKTLLKKGYARAVYYAPNGKYRKAFNKLQATAKKKKKGFWKDGYSVAFPS